MKRRTLSLKRETLTELAPADLTSVVGAASGISCPLKACVVAVSEGISCHASCGHSGCCSLETCGV